MPARLSAGLTLAATLALTVPITATAQSEDMLKPHLGPLARLARKKTRQGDVTIAIQGGWYRMLGTEPDAVGRWSIRMSGEKASGRRTRARVFTRATDLYTSLAGVVFGHDETLGYVGVAVGSDGRAHYVTMNETRAGHEWLPDTHPRMDGTDLLEVIHYPTMVQILLNGDPIVRYPYPAEKERAFGVFHVGTGLSGFTEFSIQR